MPLQLRPYQAQAVDRVEAALGRGVRKQLGVCATGGGKTFIFATVGQRMGCRTLVLAHRDELLDGARAEFAQAWPEADIGVVKAERNEVHAQVVLASVQTLANANRMAQLMAPWTDPGLLSAAEPFGLVVVDEAHHAQEDNSYGTILGALRAGAGCDTCAGRGRVPIVVEGGGYPDPADRTVPCASCDGKGAGPLLLGVTATPDRGDKLGLQGVFDEVVFAYDTLYLIRAGYLADPRGVRVKVGGLDLSNVRTVKGELDQGATGAAMTAAGYHDQVVAAWLRYGEGRPTAVFTPTVDTARLVADAAQRAGIRARYVHGGTPADERRELLKRDGSWERDDVTMVANCAVLTEGTNLPWVSCIVPPLTKVRGKYAQCVGRGLRLYPGKDGCLVLDLVGVTGTHNLVGLPLLFGLERKHADALYAGERPLSDVVQDRDDELVRLGLMKAEDAELFRSLRTEGVAWVQAHAVGDPMRRYVRTLGRARDGTALPTVVLAQRGPEMWTAGLWWPEGKTPAGVRTPERKLVLVADVDMEMAQATAEEYVRSQSRGGLTDADAAWRKRKPKRTQLAAAKKWHLKVKPEWTAGQLSDELDAHIARIKARPKGRR